MTSRQPKLGDCSEAPTPATHYGLLLNYGLRTKDYLDLISVHNLS